MIPRLRCSTIVTIMLPVLCLAGEPGSCVLLHSDTSRGVLTGIARLDFAGLSFPAPGVPEGEKEASSAARKSPWLAAGLSIIVPGAGEFYSESYLRSALFLAAEAALWVLAYTYDQKGNHQTDYFQGYANAHWNVVNYAQYAQSHYNPGNGPYNWLIPGTQGDPPWMRVNWAELNRMESDIGATAAGMYYSHQLPSYNTQSYYELIGKYPQFNQGWDDAPPSFSYGNQLSAELLYYSGQRGLANTYYVRSSLFVGITVVNHVVSAIDAALTAGSYNRGVHASVGVQTIPTEHGPVTIPSLCLRCGL
jgi:hypothetical protein